MCRFDPGPVADTHSNLLTRTGTWVFAMEDRGIEDRDVTDSWEQQLPDFVVSMDGCREHCPKVKFLKKVSRPQ
jgi:hypothetical protein